MKNWIFKLKHIFSRITSCHFNDDAYHYGSLKFIWGIKAADDLCKEDACLYTMNDIDICYDEDTKKYMLGVETVYCFNNRTQDECYYLKDLLIKFTKYMIDNNLEIDTDVHLNEMYIEKPMEANSISKLYTQFKIFVEGFCAVNGGNADE